MAFDSLSDKLQNIFKNLRGKGRLSEADVKAALKEVKMALLEADVNFKVVKNFIKSVEERAIGQDVMSSLTPGQMVIKIVNEEMISLMGSETTEIKLKSGNEITVIMMAGLQGAGKTTTTAKLAGKFKEKGKKPLLVACDVYRPAAIEQLTINGNKQEVEVFSMGTGHNPVDIAKASIAHAKDNNFNIVILDTAGRLHVDENMMEELINIKNEVEVDQTILVVDSMTGQDAVNVAASFNEKVGIDGVILTKLDGDTRGGAALSIKAVTGKPILYVGMGEKLSDLEQFYPDRMASRILGMGDVLTLIEKAEAQIDADKAKEMEAKLKKAEFDFDDFLEYMGQIRNMGGIGSIMSMLPGMGLGGNMKNLQMPDEDEAEANLKRTEAIIQSMTAKERKNPDIINPSRKNRIARGAGVNISEVNRLIKQFEQMKKMIISAHYDSAEDSVGANDNGSGVAAVLELARILKDTEMPYNVKFILFSGEEKYMLGSRWYVGNLSEDERKQIIGVINIDTIAEKSDLGYMAMIEGNKRPDDIEYDDEGLKKLAELNKNSMSDLFTSSDGFYLTMATNSDHYPFALVDIPAVSIVQDWQDGLNVNDSSDVKENMDMQRIVEVIEKVTEVLSEIPSNN